MNDFLRMFITFSAAIGLLISTMFIILITWAKYDYDQDKVQQLLDKMEGKRRVFRYGRWLYIWVFSFAWTLTAIMTYLK
jgi:hypothetical protein